MKASSKRSLSLLASAALLIGALVFYANFISPEYDNIQELRGNLAAKTKLFDGQKEIIDRVSDLLSQYQSAARLQEIISLVLPLGADTASLFQQIYSLGQNSGLQMISLSLSQPSSDSSGLGMVRINLGLRGSYNALKSFLQTLETNIRIMDVNHLTIRDDTYNLSVDAYYQ
ncbi:MAG: type 4a pilus biogenesis protein PilO [bacterium]|nr:type 4a pilus biogenesis protein PilO [bacterium]